MTEPNHAQISLFRALVKLAQLRRLPLDSAQLQAVIAAMPRPDLAQCLAQMQLVPAKALRRADATFCPLLVETERGFGLLITQKPQGAWACLWLDPQSGELVESLEPLPEGARFWRVSLQPRFSARQSPSLRIILAELLAERRGLLEIAAGALFISVIALASSLYSMQVYDRVIPTGAQATLLVLSLGMLLAAGFDMAAKWARAHVVSDLADRLDQRLARATYARFLGLRLEKMPASVGIMAARLRAYESARQFLISLLGTLAVDLPLALILLSVFAAIGGGLALIPAGFLVLGGLAAVFSARKIEAIARDSLPAHNLKMGHLVESVEAAEIIKSGNGGWRMLARWLDLTDGARGLDRAMKDASDGFQYLIGLFQQLAYVALIGLGALAVGRGSVTMGGLIACSILSGRVLAPLATLANAIVQWANTKASLQDLDRFWALPQEVGEGASPLYVERIKGDYQIEDLRVELGGFAALSLERLRISAGEQVAILGPIGSGKTTLLRVLSGLYQPTQGRITLDGLALGAMDKASLARQIAFVPQDGRLIAGSLRDNLLLGLEDPGDGALIACAQQTGLYESVIAPHPNGLAREITEGGHGLSGGQRQLVHITRALLKNPRIWLLYEPTAAMDGQTEARVLAALAQARAAAPDSVMITVTHKPQIAALAERVLVLQGGALVLDGPRAAVFARLAAPPSEA